MTKSAAEQLAQGLEQVARAIRLLVEEGQSPTAVEESLKTAAAAKALGFAPSYLLRLAKAGQIASTGQGRKRRFLTSDIEAYRRRNRNTSRRPHDFMTFGGQGAESARQH